MRKIVGYVIVSATLVFAGVWVVAQVDLGNLHTFLPGTKIEAGLMNQNFDLLRQAIEEVQAPAGGVASLNGQDGNLTLEAGDNVSIDDAQAGTIVISATASGTGGGDVTGVTAGAGLLGGGDSGDVTLRVDFDGSGSEPSVARSDHDHDERYYSQAQVDALVAAADPAGRVATFNLEECPAGWTEFVQGRGRTVVGLQAGGLLAGESGNPLDDRALPSHGHTVSFGNVSTSSSGSHEHIWANISGKVWADGEENEIIAWTDGMDSDGNGFFPLAVEDGNAGNFRTNTDGNHSHSVNIPSATTADAEHGMPYVQLLMCEKD